MKTLAQSCPQSLPLAGSRWGWWMWETGRLPQWWLVWMELKYKCNRFYTSKTKYDETCCLTKSNSGWVNSTTWKLCGESTYSCGVAMTSCKANSYVILRYTITNIHTPLIDTVFVIFCLVDYTISSHSGPWSWCSPGDSDTGMSNYFSC